MSCGLLYVVGQLGPGGLEHQLYYLLQTMDRTRYRPAVAVWNYSENDLYVPKIRALDVPLYSFATKLSASKKLIQLRRLIGQLKPALVHSYCLYLNFVVSLACWGRRVIAVGSVRSDFETGRRDAGSVIGILSSRWPLHLICNSSKAFESARCARGLFIPGSLSVVRNALSLEEFHFVPLSSARAACIVGVGSLLPVKRWDRLLRAAMALKNRGFDFLIRISGDGPLRDSLQQQAKALGLADTVEFTGHNNDIPGLLADATFLAHTSDTEGCPNAVMEAMACGRAVVATNVGDVPYLVEDGKTGFVVSREDEITFTQRLATLIADRDLCRRMGEAGRLKAEHEFRLQRMVAETLAAYKTAGWKDT